MARTFSQKIMTPFSYQAVYDFHTVKVTVHIVKDVAKRKPTLQESLLDAPTLTDEALEQYDTTREWMNQWQINEFL